MVTNAPSGGGAGSGGGLRVGGGQEARGNSLYFEFGCEPKTDLKSKVCQKE